MAEILESEFVNSSLKKTISQNYQNLANKSKQL